MSFIEQKRLQSGPFTNITLSTDLDFGITGLSKDSFVIMFPENLVTNIIDRKDVMIGYIYKTCPASQNITVRIANHDDNIHSDKDCRWHLLSMEHLLSHSKLNLMLSLIFISMECIIIFILYRHYKNSIWFDCRRIESYII